MFLQLNIIVYFCPKYTNNHTIIYNNEYKQTFYGVLGHKVEIPCRAD